MVRDVLAPDTYKQVPHLLMMAALLVFWKMGTSCASLVPLLRSARRIAALFPIDMLDDDHIMQASKYAQTLSYRASRLVPGVNCTERALSVRVWLASQGIDSRIVIGFRKQNAIEGHAWLEVITSSAPVILFNNPHSGYKRSFCEDTLPKKGRF